VRGKGSKLGKPCPKARLSQDRLPIEPFSGLLRSGLLPFSGFGIFTFGKSSWRPANGNLFRGHIPLPGFQIT
jgi:hypothetical protein